MKNWRIFHWQYFNREYCNKKGGIVTEGNTISGVTQSAPPLTIKLADLFANVNPNDESFLKYVPKQFLSEQPAQLTGTSPSDSRNRRYSIRRITGDSGTDYGIGVYLDSTLLDGLTDDERTKIVKEYIKEIGGDSFTASDQRGNQHSIVIADSRKFINKSGKRVPADKDLMYRSDLKIKQEAIANVDELIMVSSFDRVEPAKHPHEWLDNSGLNDWDRWNVYIQEKNPFGKQLFVLLIP